MAKGLLQLREGSAGEGQIRHNLRPNAISDGSYMVSGVDCE